MEFSRQGYWSELPFPFPKTCNKLLSRYYYPHVICEETEASERLSNLPKVTQQFRIQIQATQLQNPVSLTTLYTVSWFLFYSDRHLSSAQNITLSVPKGQDSTGHIHGLWQRPHFLLQLLPRDYNPHTQNISSHPFPQQMPSAFTSKPSLKLLALFNCFVRWLYCFGSSTWGLSSPTRDQTRVPCTGSLKSHPLDCQGSSKFHYFKCPYPSSCFHPITQHQVQMPHPPQTFPKPIQMEWVCWPLSPCDSVYLQWSVYYNLPIFLLSQCKSLESRDYIWSIPFSYLVSLTAWKKVIARNSCLINNHWG